MMREGLKTYAKNAEYPIHINQKRIGMLRADRESTYIEKGRLGGGDSNGRVK
jgi:hypothetical protein